jgi:hypothetical protein
MLSTKSCYLPQKVRSPSRGKSNVQDSLAMHSLSQSVINGPQVSSTSFEKVRDGVNNASSGSNASVSAYRDGNKNGNFHQNHSSFFGYSNRKYGYTGVTGIGQTQTSMELNVDDVLSGKNRKIEHLESKNNDLQVKSLSFL